MAVTFIEAFDWLDLGMTATQIATALSDRKNLSIHNLTSTDAQTVAGPGGNGTALRMRETDQYLRFKLSKTSAATDELGCGGWFRFNDAGNSNWAAQDFLGFVDTAGDRYVVNLRVNNGILSVYRRTTFLQYADFYFQPNEWYFIAYKTVVNDTTGSYVVEVDGVEVLNVTGTDTREGGNGICDTVQIAGAASGDNGFDIGGLIAWDDQGGNVTDFPSHPIVFHSIHPDGDGDDEDWSTSSGTDSYALVNETAPHDDDSDYIEDSTSSNRTLFTYENIPTAHTGILGIAINTVVRETDASDFTLINTVKSNGTLYPEAAQAIAGQTYENIPNVLDQDPDTSSGWTVANLNSAQFGVEVG